MAPGAGEAAALEKNSCSKPRPIFCGHALDFENEAGFVHKIRVRGFEVSRVRGIDISMLVFYSSQVRCVYFKRIYHDQSASLS